VFVFVCASLARSLADDRLLRALVCERQGARWRECRPREEEILEAELCPPDPCRCAEDGVSGGAQTMFQQGCASYFG
jgi:hypothetical protein